VVLGAPATRVQRSRPERVSTWTRGSSSATTALERSTFSDVYAFGFDPETGRRSRDAWSPLFKTKISSFRRCARCWGWSCRCGHHRRTASIGLIDTEPDDDGNIRKYPLVSRLGERIVPSLALQTAAVARNARVVPLLDSETDTEVLSYVGLMPMDGTMDGP
jgi:hypothetical protein